MLNVFLTLSPKISCAYDYQSKAAKGVHAFFLVDLYKLDSRHRSSSFPPSPLQKRGHTEDIVAVTFGEPSHLATVSYEGLIIVWNIVSGFSIARIPYPNTK